MGKNLYIKTYLMTALAYDFWKKGKIYFSFSEEKFLSKEDYEQVKNNIVQWYHDNTEKMIDVTDDEKIQHLLEVEEDIYSYERFCEGYYNDNHSISEWKVEELDKYTVMLIVATYC